MADAARLHPWPDDVEIGVGRRLLDRGVSGQDQIDPLAARDLLDQEGGAVDADAVGEDDGCRRKTVHVTRPRACAQ